MKVNYNVNECMYVVSNYRLPTLQDNYILQILVNIIMTWYHL